MKKIKLSIILILLIRNIFGQFQFTPVTTLNFGRTDATIQGIGIGFWPANTPTNSRFHINNFLCNQPNGPLNGLLFRSDGNQNIDNKWQMFTGTSNNNATEKGILFTSPNSSNGGYLIPSNINSAINHLNIQASQGDIIFRANGNLLNGVSGSGVMNDRMRITAVHFTEPNTVPTNIPFTRVAISSGQTPYFALAQQDKFIVNPLAMLHMGDLWPNGAGAHRLWMNYGTFITRQSDGAYFGVRQNEDPQHFSNPDKTDAIISWGDNANIGVGDTKYDRLRIIFNSSFNQGAPGGTSANTNGLECMHFAPIATPGPGDSRIVYVGIGDFSINNPIHPFGDPSRKLEILSDKLTANSNGNPQLRLTNFQQDPNNINTTGRFSELHSTQVGDLEIQTLDNTQAITPTQNLKQRFVGINANNPGNTLEINSRYLNFTIPNGQPQAPTYGLPTGWAGLRFTDLNSNSTPQLNPSQNVLSVNANGDVILTPAPNTIPIASNGIVVNAGIIQLGSNCATTNASGKSVQGLQNTRYLHLNGNNFIFGDGGRVGIGMPPFPPGNSCAVGNKLEVISTTGVPYHPGVLPSVNGASGLRLTNLTSTSAPLPNGTNGVNASNLLSVDVNGDVVLVAAITGGSNADNGLSSSGPTASFLHLGQNIGALGNPGQLLNDREIPMNNFNLFFTDGVSATNNQNRFQIGPFNQTLANLMNPKLASINISSTANRISGWFSTVYNLPTLALNLNPLYFGNISGFRSIGVAAFGVDTIHAGGRSIGSTNFAYQIGGGAGQGNAIAVSAKAVGTNNLGSVSGIYGIAFGNAANVYGGFFNSNAQGSISGNAYGVNADVTNGFYNYGVYANAPTPNGTNTTNNNNYAGFFNGGVYAAQTIFPSDELIKKDKNNITSALSKISLIDPISFSFDTVIANQKGLSLPGGLQYGFKAQQLELVYPELVTMIHKPETRDTIGNVLKPSYDFKGINYIGFIALLTKGVQEQKLTIDSLKTLTTKQDSINNSLQAQINNLVSTFSACCTSTNGSKASGNSFVSTNVPTSKQDVELCDKNIIVLNQNVPNPFAESTVITYNIPVDFKVAQIIFNTTDGRIIKAVDIIAKGRGELNVYANDLTNGFYSYFLIVDGKIIDTKKLIKQN